MIAPSRRHRIVRRRQIPVPGWMQLVVRERDSFFRVLFENEHVVGVLADPVSSRIVDANPAACAFYGWSRAEMQGMDIEAINVLEPERLATLMRHALEEECSRFNFRHRLADGSIRDVRVCSSPILLAGRRLLWSIVLEGRGLAGAFG